MAQHTQNMLIYSIGILLDCEEKNVLTGTKKPPHSQKRSTTRERRGDTTQNRRRDATITQHLTEKFSSPSKSLYTWPDWSLYFAPSSAAGFKLATGNRLIDWWGWWCKRQDWLSPNSITPTLRLCRRLSLCIVTD